jgi:heat shock protein HtpX
MRENLLSTPLDERERRRHRWRNLLHSALLLLGMVGLLALCTWPIFGLSGVPWVLLGGLLGLLLSPRLSPRFVLSLYQTREVGWHEFPPGIEVLQDLAGRAGISRPSLHYVPSRTLNAFSLGSPEESAIAVTDGMLRSLSLREFAGVMAHEISHIRHNDLWVMGLADTITRLTRVMSLLGILLLIVNVPLALVGQAVVPWIGVAVLIVAPTVGSLLQLALSRSREYDADMDAAGLTGDPEGLASALEKLDRYQGRFWEDIFAPGRRIPDPSLLRTHPPTDQRVARLRSLQPCEGDARFRDLSDRIDGQGLGAHDRPPRWRASGLWF